MLHDCIAFYADNVIHSLPSRFSNNFVNSIAKANRTKSLKDAALSFLDRVQRVSFTWLICSCSSNTHFIDLLILGSIIS